MRPHAHAASKLIFCSMRVPVEVLTVCARCLNRRSVSALRDRAKYSGFETKEEEELRTECTFKPKINPSRTATPVGDCSAPCDAVEFVYCMIGFMP